MTTPARATRAGFTLIEILVAVTIIAMVSTLIYTGFAQTSRNKQRIEGDLERNHEVRVGIERMARELSMAYASAQLNSSAALQTVRTALVGTEAGRGSRIDFTSFSHQRLYRDAHESDQNELSYYVGEDPDDKARHSLLRREQRRPDADPLKGGQVQVLIHDVTKFDLAYLDPQSGLWIRTWDSTQAAMQPNRLPSQVQIKVTVPNLRGTGPDETFGTRAAVPLQYALNHAIYYPQ